MTQDRVRRQVRRKNEGAVISLDDDVLAGAIAAERDVLADLDARVLVRMCL